MKSRTKAVRDVVTRRFDQYVADLQAYLRQPGVSSTGFGIRESAELTAEYLRPLCGEDVRIVQTDGHPVVLGRAVSNDPSAKTLLVYSFYDVVPPAADEDEWLSPPFAANIVDAEKLGLPGDFGEVLCGRGSIDHRGPHHWRALRAFGGERGNWGSTDQRHLRHRGRGRGPFAQPGEIRS